MGFDDFLNEIAEIAVLDGILEQHRTRTAYSTGYGFGQGPLGVGVSVNDVGFDIPLGDGLEYDPVTGDFGVEIVPGLDINF